MKSIALLERLLLMCAPPGGRILDPFCGLASVGCAAAALDNDYVYTGIEERPDYADLARKRLRHWVGKSAQRKAG